MPAPTFPTQSGALTLDGPAGALEALVECPPPERERRAVAVVGHPHPPDGGTLHNKVVSTIARALAELGIASVRFNFRGVGASAGQYDEGRGETLDYLAVAQWAAAQRPGDALWLCGFSFGAWVALRAARQLPVQQMVLVAPPVGFRDFVGVPPPSCPWLLVQGEADDVVAPQAVYDWAAAATPPPTLVRMAETGHFFHGRLVDLRGAIRNGVAKPLPPFRGTA
ncbi:MAG: alpha/beta hydrolase [Xanthomonadaceae bacterium]|jgi:alpha/beta superfamily hydrolase|nr:alpha/beta hydrolase [Xanthomonadaceae bacterium]